jgi:6-phosphogluconolactonase (cycloisomerase 2 family)
LALLAAVPGRAAAKTFVYVHDSGAANNQIYGLSVSNDGSLHTLPNPPFSTNNTPTGCGGDCRTLSYSPKDRLLFAAGASGISVLRVAKSGQLSLVTGSPFGPVTGYIGVPAVRKGSATYVYAADNTNDKLRGFKVQPDDTLVELPGSPVITGNSPVSVLFSHGLLYVANQGNPASISVLKVAGNGTLTAAVGSPFVPGQGLFTVYAPGNGKFVYSGEDSGSSVLAFRANLNTGVLTALSGSPFSSSPVDTDNGLVVGPKFILTATDDNLTQVFRIKKSDGSLSKLGDVQENGLDTINCGAFTTSGVLLMACKSNQNIRNYRLNSSTGALTPGDNVPLIGLSDPTAVVPIQR